MPAGASPASSCCAAPATLEVPRRDTRRSPASRSATNSLRTPCSGPSSTSSASAMRPRGEASQPALDRLGVSAGRPPRRLHGLAARPRGVGDGRRRAAVYAAFEGEELLSARAGARVPLFGLAMDIGTTSLAAALVALDTGTVVASGSQLNPRWRTVRTSSPGSGTRSRVPTAARTLRPPFARGSPPRSAMFWRAAGCRGRVDVVIGRCCRQPDDDCTRGRALKSVLWVLRPTLACGHATCRAAQQTCDCRFTRMRTVWVFPQVGATSVATRYPRPSPATWIAVLGGAFWWISEPTPRCWSSGDGRIVATSAAAGPAFEGVAIRKGMRAAAGAIDVVSFGEDGMVAADVIGGGLATGICGSGLIDLVAEMLRAGARVVERAISGRPTRSGNWFPPPFVNDWCRPTGVQAFAVVPPSGPRGADGILLTARDIREVQLAKGSIMTAATLACRHLGFDVLRPRRGARGGRVRQLRQEIERAADRPRSGHRPRAHPVGRQCRRRRCPARAAGPRRAGCARGAWPKARNTSSSPRAPATRPRSWSCSRSRRHVSRDDPSRTRISETESVDESLRP